ncbi:hypothetical protein [Yersinia kristensenii]|uniref:hypothetical protein n=1 Tax=Yersinia kristensenii TaxID=28152 RepID=UPI00066D9927|nr:hypothetical protein [Yersinia kristensenii]
MTTLFYCTETGGATAPMGAPTAYAVTTHSAHFPFNQLCQQFLGRVSGPFVFIGIYLANGYAYSAN